LEQAEILFAQIEDAEIQKQIEKLEATKKANKWKIKS
jgi:methionyl-tRNA synthetase